MDQIATIAPPALNRDQINSLGLAREPANTRRSEEHTSELQSH